MSGNVPLGRCAKYERCVALRLLLGGYVGGLSNAERMSHFRKDSAM